MRNFIYFMTVFMAINCLAEEEQLLPIKPTEPVAMNFRQVEFGSNGVQKEISVISDVLSLALGIIGGGFIDKKMVAISTAYLVHDITISTWLRLSALAILLSVVRLGMVGELKNRDRDG